MADKTTLADYLAELGVDVNNMQEFLNKLSQMLTTSSDTVTINQTLQDGTSKAFNVPSFAYLKNKITAVDDKFNSLLTGNAGRVAIKDQNGNVKTFELQDISQVVTELDQVSTKSVPTPTSFNYKTNWFFESFLNPLIYVDIPVNNIFLDDVDKFDVTRVIVQPKSTEDQDYFDSTYKGKNEISYSDLIKDLSARSISFFEDVNEVQLPLSQNKKTGSFDILNKLTDTEVSLVAGESLTSTVTKYVLNSLRYNEKSDLSPNGIVQRSLKVGDLLITEDNSEYRVSAVDINQTSVTLERIFGLGDLTAGSNKLRIKPELLPITTLSINLGYNEREVIFLRPASSRLRVTTQYQSLGFGIFTNELTITLADGTSLTLADFYTQFVSDFGLLFVNYAKDKKLPAALGEVPNAVVLATTDFKVIQADAHIQESDNVDQIKKNISEIETVKTQIREVDKQISEKRAELNTNAALTSAQQLKLSRDLATLADSRKTLSTDHASKVSSVTTAVKTDPGIIKAPTYVIKGFWHVPDAKLTSHGYQQVVQFKVAYRVLSKTGTAEKAQQISFKDPNGNIITGSFSPWKEVLTKSRAKAYNPLTGFYEWQIEDVTNPEVVNANQIEIPISSGQVIEIKIKSLSEAGWPDTPLESDWSNVITVEFPAEIKTVEDISIVSQQAFAEEAKINFQDELNAKGLDIHLGTSFTSRDKYFAHKAEDIASGFFASDGSIIDLFSKLKTITDALTAIQTSIASGTGKLKVSIIDQLGNQVEVTNGQTVNIFAGYYKDQIKNTNRTTTTYDDGKIITNQYLIQLENTSQTALQLIANINGGIGEAVPISSPAFYPTDGYNMSLRYDRVPISIHGTTPGTIGGIRQVDGYQSSQVKGQIIYSRSKAINLTDGLVEGDRQAVTKFDPHNISYQTSTNYQYTGKVIANTTVPYASGHYLPFNPTLSALNVQYLGTPKALSTNANVWKGTLDTSNAPVGGGLLSEFCISTDHPDIKPGGKYNQPWAAIYKPVYSTANTTDQVTLPFSHAPHFEITQAEGTNAFGAKYMQQAAYRKPIAPNPLTAVPDENSYPIKQGFVPNDAYLIGKYTCGAYLYISPNSYESISATSVTPQISKRTLEYGTSNAITIPLTFQYRCSDYLKYIGGYRTNATTGLRNVTYTKKVGFDIYLKDETFSFDVVVSAQYEKETSVITPATAIAKSLGLSKANIAV